MPRYFIADRAKVRAPSAMDLGDVNCVVSLWDALVGRTSPHRGSH